MNVRAIAVTTVVAVALAGCGSSGTAIEEEPVTTPAPQAASTTTEAPTTTEASTTTEAPTTAAPMENSFVPNGADESQIVENWDLTFGIAPFEDRADAFVDSAELEGTVNSYIRAVEGFGSIVLPVTAVVISDDRAEITYDVLGNGVSMASDLVGEMVLVDGAWKVTLESFCEAMALARNACPN